MKKKAYWKLACAFLGIMILCTGCMAGCASHPTTEQLWRIGYGLYPLII